MANALIEAVGPRLVAQAGMVLRKNCVMPRLVNSDYSPSPEMKGATVNVPIPSAVSVEDVIPGPTSTQAPDTSLKSVPINLNQWKMARFYLTDKDLQEVAASSVVPMQLQEAAKSLADFVNEYILGLYVKAYGFVGVPGTTPFATDHSEIVDAGRVLTTQLAWKRDRRFVFDEFTEANALKLPAFSNVSFTGDATAINEGRIIHKLGFDWEAMQGVQTHVKGTIAATGALTVNGAHLAGATVVSLAAGVAQTGTLVPGDIITFAGDTQTYVVSVGNTWAGSDNQSVTINPGLKVAPAGGEAVTVKETHTANIAFHRDAIAFANRPLSDNIDGMGNLIEPGFDPVSGIQYRMEVTRQNKQTEFALDILFGAEMVRPELACRVAG